MKSIRRSLAAATLLLAPAAFLVAQPAFAQQRAIVAQDAGWQQRQHFRDHRGPEITDVTPDHRDRVGERGRTRIAARFHDEGSGVATVRLRLDGRDVTGASRFDGNEIRYREDLAPGRHFAEVAVRDRAGNVSRRAWSFVVVDRDRGYRPDREYSHYGNQPQRW
jgi:hypothetical protein